jgi:hypothetical protein
LQRACQIKGEEIEVFVAFWGNRKGNSDEKW